MEDSGDEVETANWLQEVDVERFRYGYVVEMESLRKIAASKIGCSEMTADGVGGDARRCIDG